MRVAQRECEVPRYFDDPERGLPAHLEHDSNHMTFNDPGKDRWINVNRQFRFRRSSALDPVTSSCVKANSFSLQPTSSRGDSLSSVGTRILLPKVKGHLGLDALENTLTQAHVTRTRNPSTSTCIEGNETQAQAQKQVHSGSMSTTDYLAYLRARNLVFVDALLMLFNTSIQTTEMVLFSQ